MSLKSYQTKPRQIKPGEKRKDWTVDSKETDHAAVTAIIDREGGGGTRSSERACACGFILGRNRERGGEGEKGGVSLSCVLNTWTSAST